MLRILLTIGLLTILSAQSLETWTQQIEQASQRLSQGKNSQKNARLLYKYFFQVENQQLCEKILSAFVQVIANANKDAKIYAAKMLVKIAQKDLPEVVLHFLNSLEKSQNAQVKKIVNNIKLKIALYEKNSTKCITGDIKAYFTGYHRYYYNYNTMVIENPNEYPVYDIKVVLHIPFSMKYETSLLGKWNVEQRTSSWFFPQIKAKQKLQIPLCYPRRVFRYFNTNKIFRVEVFSRGKMITTNHVQMYLMCLHCCGLPTIEQRTKNVKLGQEGESTLFVWGGYHGAKNLRVTYALPKEFSFLSAEPNSYTYQNNEVVFTPTEIAPDSRQQYKIKYKVISSGHVTAVAKIRTNKSDEYYAPIEDTKHLYISQPSPSQRESFNLQVRKIIPKTVSNYFADLRSNDEKTIEQSLNFMLIYYEEYPELAATLPQLIHRNLSPENLNTLIIIFARTKSKKVVPALLQMFSTVPEELQIRILKTLSSIGVENNDMVLHVLEFALQKNSKMKEEALDLAESTTESYPSLRSLLLDILIHEKMDLHYKTIKVLNNMNLVNSQTNEILVQKLHQAFSAQGFASWTYSQIKREIYKVLAKQKDLSVVPHLLKLKPSSLYDQKDLVTILWKITGKDYSKDIISAKDLKKLDLQLDKEDQTDW